MSKRVNVKLSEKEAEALAEACGFREAGDTSDLTASEFTALMRAFAKLQQARKGEKTKP